MNLCFKKLTLLAVEKTDSNPVHAENKLRIGGCWGRGGDGHGGGHLRG